LPKGAIPIHCAPWQPWARGRIWRYLRARCFRTSWRQVNLMRVPTKSSAPLGTALMGSTSMIIGEAVAPTSPAEAPPASTARGGVPTLASATGGEATLPQLLLVAE
jgi:hypothetical protein